MKRTSNFYKVAFTPFYRAMDFYVQFNKEFYIEKIWLGRQLASETLEEIERFRTEQYQKDQRYLLAKDTHSVIREKRVDMNSYHIIARSRTSHDIVGVLRLSPYPFESETYISDDLSSYEDYLEISRLIVRDRGIGIGKKMLICAGKFAITQTTYEGFTAICRPERLGMFSSFGLLKRSSFELPERGGQYHFISANFSLISKKALLRFFEPKKLSRA